MEDNYEKKPKNFPFELDTPIVMSSKQVEQLQVFYGKNESELEIYKDYYFTIRDSKYFGQFDVTVSSKN